MLLLQQHVTLASTVSDMVDMPSAAVGVVAVEKEEVALLGEEVAACLIALHQYGRIRFRHRRRPS